MNSKPRVLAISGSTRAQSTNSTLIHAIREMAAEQFNLSVFNDLALLPHFNPDLDNEVPPETVLSFRKSLRDADGILICTPEYAMGVPGTLKNAVDWTVSSMEFSGKPTVLITASSLGEKGHTSLLATLEIIEAHITPETQLLISHARTKIAANGTITDSSTQAQLTQLILSFTSILKNKPLI